ncbi:MAG: Arc family DNA-binding protein [Desulfobacteraceae bacterium]|nr:Arc family DNA-binding protein [Desulfobacteraceae bacterium]
MQTITVKNIPSDIHQSLKNIAKLNHRSLNNEIIYCLEKYTKISKVDPAVLINKARQVRFGISHKFTDEEIQDAKNEGRK